MHTPLDDDEIVISAIPPLEIASHITVKQRIFSIPNGNREVIAVYLITAHDLELA